jgi:hypothetical protein
MIWGFLTNKIVILRPFFRAECTAQGAAAGSEQAPGQLGNQAGEDADVEPTD